jgi:hypothetical protein
MIQKMAAGAIVVADNIRTFRKALRPSVERMQGSNSGLSALTVPIGEGMEFSVR